MKAASLLKLPAVKPAQPKLMPKPGLPQYIKAQYSVCGNFHDYIWLFKTIRLSAHWDTEQMAQVLTQHRLLKELE